MPKIGKELITMGNMAQWIAQATDVAIPNASQFTFIFIVQKKQRYNICNAVAIFLVLLNHLNSSLLASCLDVALQKIKQ